MRTEKLMQIREFDRPIPKPTEDDFEEFIRATEARFVTKRFNRDNSLEGARRRSHECSEAR